MSSSIMPIHITVHRKDGYIESRYVGAITNDELLDTWREYNERPDANAGLNELADLREADMRAVTSEGIRALSSQTKHFLNANDVLRRKLAIVAPEQLPFGLSRMYEALMADPRQTVHVFKDIEEAVAWLKKP